MDDFIDQDPVVISFTRPTKTTTAAGGVVVSGTTTLDPQTFYFQPFKRRLTREYHYNPQSHGEDKVEDVDYILIGSPDMDVQVEDYFTTTSGGRLDAGRYTVEFVSPRQWDRRLIGIRLRG